MHVQHQYPLDKLETMILVALFVLSISIAQLSIAVSAERPWHELSPEEQLERKRAFIERELPRVTEEMQRVIDRDEAEGDVLEKLDKELRGVVE